MTNTREVVLGYWLLSRTLSDLSIPSRVPLPLQGVSQFRFLRFSVKGPVRSEFLVLGHRLERSRDSEPVRAISDFGCRCI